jgi:hypothetical protein
LLFDGRTHQVPAGHRGPCQLLPIPHGCKLKQNKRLMVFNRVWKSATVLPTFLAHPLAFIPDLAADCAPNTHARLESPVWMK